MNKDLLIYESGNGGDMALQNGDIAVGDPLLQQAYLAMFGGNIEALTKGNEPVTEARGDYWANTVFWRADKDRQMNSNTERALRAAPLTSNGRSSVINAIQVDLKYLQSYATVTVDVVITGVNGWKLSIMLKRPGQPNVSLQVLWDNATGESVVMRSI